VNIQEVHFAYHGWANSLNPIIQLIFLGSTDPVSKQIKKKAAEHWKNLLDRGMPLDDIEKDSRKKFPEMWDDLAPVLNFSSNQKPNKSIDTQIVDLFKETTDKWDVFYKIIVRNEREDCIKPLLQSVKNINFLYNDKDADFTNFNNLDFMNRVYLVKEKIETLLSLTPEQRANGIFQKWQRFIVDSYKHTSNRDLLLGAIGKNKTKSTAKKHEKVCVECKKPFLSVRSDAQTCSPKCRKKRHEDNKTLNLTRSIRRNR
jgi:hypothetical protein